MDELADLLREIRDNQKVQIARLDESLALQREQFEIVKTQIGRTERLHDRAEKIQDVSAAVVGGARKMLIVVTPILIAAIAYLSWLILR